MRKDQPIEAKKNFARVESWTVYGAIGPCFDKPVFMLAKSTNMDDVDQFLRSLLAHRSNQYSKQPIHVVIDNNPAHVNAYKRLKDYTGLNLVYQPSESPEFNCQETVWRMVKHSYRKKMFRRDQDLKDGNDHRTFILEVLEEVKAKIDMSKVLNANERYIQ